jgi:hypothetical protein
VAEQPSLQLEAAIAAGHLLSASSFPLLELQRARVGWRMRRMGVVDVHVFLVVVWMPSCSVRTIGLSLGCSVWVTQSS